MYVTMSKFAAFGLKMSFRTHKMDFF